MSQFRRIKDSLRNSFQRTATFLRNRWDQSDFLHENWEGLGASMIGVSFFYVGFSLLVWHGWDWLSIFKSNLIMNGVTGGQLAQQLEALWYLNYLGAAAFAISLDVLVLGIIIYVFGEDVKVTS